MKPAEFKAMKPAPKIRQKRCKVCREYFTPRTSFAKVCGPECSIEFVTQEKAKKDRQERQKGLQALKTKRDHVKTANIHSTPIFAHGMPISHVSAVGGRCKLRLSVVATIVAITVVQGPRLTFDLTKTTRMVSAKSAIGTIQAAPWIIASVLSPGLAFPVSNPWKRIIRHRNGLSMTCYPYATTIAAFCAS